MPVLELTEANFDEIVLRSELPVLVDFWSPTCGPCRALVPILEELAAENEQDAVIAKVNVFECTNIGAKYGISMLPTILFFNNGTVAERMVGVQPKDKLQEALEELDE